MNGIPFIEKAENIFYLESGPAYQDRPVGNAPASNFTNPKQARVPSTRCGFNKAFILPGGVVRLLLIVNFIYFFLQ